MSHDSLSKKEQKMLYEPFADLETFGMECFAENQANGRVL